ncbi:primosomal protein N' [Uliginosibacterium paludis]|uniref:Replication restart protein PriA n=1 Tax=Uliginosibacterium paludis TaxID=1615952 RepID=A0ABV2CSS7_9RHOO
MSRIVRIALPLPRPLLFDYLVPAGMNPAVGLCARLPFGRGEKTGVVVAVDPPDAPPADKLKPVLELLEDIPPLPSEWLALTAFAARYYQHPLGEVISAALPPGLRRAVKLPRDDDPWLATTPAGRLALGEAKKITRALAAVLAVQSAGARRRSQLLGDLDGDASGAIREARAKGWLEIVARAGEREPIGALTLNTAQQAAVHAVNDAAGSFRPFLLFGVTGSGKTEVYLHQIAHTLAQGRQALMLVPEIGLTPQLMERVASRFPGANLVSLHSGMADGARSLGFVQALKGEADIVLGTRLSVFVPLPRLGLIVVDEEHDASFKQQDGLRYSARDLAVWRANAEKLPIVLGSATPSLETWQHAEAGRYTRLDLPLPAVADKPPSLRRIDTRRVKLDHGLSPGLIEGIRTRLARGEQSLVFLNRRGYAPVIACPQCNWVSACPHCSANMVFHAADRALRCHHCGHEGRVPHICPGCGNQDLHAFGRGTQRLEERLGEHFPEARIERVDRDAVRTPAQWEAVRARIEAREIDILVGTQMLAKGHDFPMLTLVGIVGADAGLYAADFRAPERLFQQLMQVAGRSGRGELPGEVLVQTEFPEHPLYEHLARRDYPGFAKRELAERKMAGFPPWGYHAVLRAEAPELDAAIAWLNTARAVAESLQSPVMLYDVVPMRLVRRARLERAQLVLESDNRPGLQATLAALMPLLYALKCPRELRWHIDVDPGEL